MNHTRIVALLSVLALLASLPLSVALAQGTPPFRVVGTAEIDGEQAAEGSMVIAMIDGEKSGEGIVDAWGILLCRHRGRRGRHADLHADNGRGRVGQDLYGRDPGRRDGRHARATSLELI